MEIYKQLYQKYKDKIIDNYEYWFMADILTDIDENGGFETLIDDQYQFLFNIELSRGLKNIIESLLFKKEEGKDKNQEYKELIISFLKLKRIVDKKIIENSAYDESFVNEYIFDFEKIKKSNNYNIKFNKNLLNFEELINEIVDFTIQKGYVNSEKEIFKSFFTSDNPDTIIWSKTLKELAVFIQSLYNHRIILNSTNLPKITIKYFENEKGKIALTSLRKFFSDAKDTELDYCPEIRTFFRDLERNKKIKFS